MPVILTSDGLSSQAIIETFSKLLNAEFKKAAIVITADPKYREKNRKAVSTKKEFEIIGYQSNNIF